MVTGEIALLLANPERLLFKDVVLMMDVLAMSKPSKAEWLLQLMIQIKEVDFNFDSDLATGQLSCSGSKEVLNAVELRRRSEILIAKSMTVLRRSAVATRISRTARIDMESRRKSVPQQPADSLDQSSEATLTFLFEECRSLRQRSTMAVLRSQDLAERHEATKTAQHKLFSVHSMSIRRCLRVSSAT